MALPGQKTFLELQNEIAVNVFAQAAAGTNTNPTLSTIKNIINKWYKRFFDQHKWIWAQKETTFPTVANQVRYILPDDTLKIITMQIRNLVRDIREIDRDRFIKDYPGGWTTITAAVPLVYMYAPPVASGTSKNALQVDMWPYPDQIYTITMDYMARFTPMSLDTDVPVIPPEYDPVLVHGPLSEIMQMLGDARWEYHRNEYESYRKRAWQDNEAQMNSMNQLRDITGENQINGYPGLIQPYHY